MCRFVFCDVFGSKRALRRNACLGAVPRGRIALPAFARRVEPFLARPRVVDQFAVRLRIRQFDAGPRAPGSAERDALHFHGGECDLRRRHAATQHQTDFLRQSGRILDGPGRIVRPGAADCLDDRTGGFEVHRLAGPVLHADFDRGQFAALGCQPNVVRGLDAVVGFLHLGQQRGFRRRTVGAKPEDGFVGGIFDDPLQVGSGLGTQSPQDFCINLDAACRHASCSVAVVSCVCIG